MRAWIIAALIIAAFAFPTYAQSSLEDVCTSLEGFDDITFSPDASPEQLEAQIYVVTGFSLLESLPATAIDMFNDALEADEENANAYLGRGCANILQGDEDAAQEDFVQFIALTDDAELADTISSLVFGSTTTTTDIPASAGDECVMVTRNPPPFVDVADAQEFIDDFDESVKSPDYIDRSDAYLCVGDIDAAIVDLTTLIGQEPDEPEGYATRGVIYRRLAEYDSALEDFNAALDLDADYLDAVNGRAYTNYLLGEYELCIEDYDHSIDLYDEDAIAFGNRGLCYGALGEDETAVEDYNRAIDLAPDNAIIIGNRAVSYRMLGEYELALEDNNRAIEIDPTDPYYFVERGLVYYEMEQYRSAANDFITATELDSEYRSAWLYLGDSQRWLKDNAAAVEAYQVYLELYPDSPYLDELEEFIEDNQ